MSSTVIDCHGQVGSGETWADSGVTRWVDYKVELLLQRAAEAEHLILGQGVGIFEPELQRL